MSDDSENSDVENGVKVKLEDDDESSENSETSDAENETDVKSEVKSEASEEGKENIRGSGLLTLRQLFDHKNKIKKRNRPYWKSPEIVTVIIIKDIKGCF